MGPRVLYWKGGDFIFPRFGEAFGKCQGYFGKNLGVENAIDIWWAEAKDAIEYPMMTEHYQPINTKPKG